MSKYLLFTAVLSIPALALALTQPQNPSSQNQPAQNQTAENQLDTQTKKVMDTAAKQGYPLTVGGSVAERVKIEAVLLPFKVCSRVFGREIANNYAVVEITVSNHNADASLIVHTVFIDYSQWALSGHIYLEQAANAREAYRQQSTNTSHAAASNQAAQPNTTGKSEVAGNASQPPLMADSAPYETQSKANQIASVEYRTVRGEALDAQPGTSRNRTIRWLRFAGSIASAFSFVTRDQDIVHGIAAFTGQGVPAAETLWPDNTVEQLNRISDLGFKVNKVIPKNASDVIVAFFPLDRFLTPGLKTLYKESPALFFAPYAMTFDLEARKKLRPIFEEFLGSKSKADCFLRRLPQIYMADYLRAVENPGQLPSPTPTPAAASGVQSSSAQTPAEGKGASQDQCNTSDRPNDQEVATVMKFLAHASLNTVRVFVGGDFTVNVNDIPATVNGVELDGGAAAWSSSGDKTGTLRGSFLATGAPQIVEADKLAISNLEATDNTNDSMLKLKMSLKNPLAPGTVLTFRVDKTNAETKRTVQGVPFTFSVPTPPPSTSMDVSNALTKDNILSVFGQNFADTTNQPLNVLLFSDPAKTTADAKLAKADFKQQTPTQIDIDLCAVKGLSLDDSIWTVKVQEGSVNSAHSATFKALASAKGKCPKAGNDSSAAQ
jgi:hypothetical protein